MANALQEVKHALTATEIKGRFNDMLGNKAPQFMASIVNAVTGNEALQKCDPSSIMAAAFVAASLDLPIDNNLGRAYIIPYGNKAQFQIGYKGFIELALRSGLYKKISTVEVYEDELVAYNPILNELEFVNDFSKCRQRMEGQSDKVVGYYARYVMLSGAEMALYMTKEQVVNHAKRYSVAYQRGKKDSPWFTDFDEMAKKTVLKRLLSKFAVLSTDIKLQTAIQEDQKAYSDESDNGRYIDNEPQPEAMPTDELAKDVVKEIVDKKQESKPDSTPEVVETVTMEDDFAAFDASFMNAPTTDDELPFK